MKQTYYSLYELNNLVSTCLSQNFTTGVWLQAEMSDVRQNANGHCYLEFIQKDGKNSVLKAKARAVVWATTYALLRPYFEQETGQPFAAGIKVLVKVSIHFHELYGYSLTVEDIDPSYTVGETERKRREIIQQLEEEGVLTLNKELSLPLNPQRIAVISSVTAAGYGDFSDQLHANPYGLVFYTRLFPAVMQGERVAASIIAALNEIYQMGELWDAVVIIRGGGATSDLSGFDDYELAVNCAQFPLPIITGIGHERDDTVIDRISHKRVKTPTAAAEFLISKLWITAERISEISEWISSYSFDYLTAQQQQISQLTVRFKNAYQQKKNNEWNLLQRITEKLPAVVRMNTNTEKYKLSRIANRFQSAYSLRKQMEYSHIEMLQQRVTYAAPDEWLKRGFGMLVVDGKRVADLSLLSEKDELIVYMQQGE
ncbi:MAG: exodeoxyribonuclease VII large subunit, partial [Bacteroidaceae bacterium]|nr:exodeoxyribonuclease VII large subunit [Bacteroidaceae bacterium]